MKQFYQNVKIVLFQKYINGQTRLFCRNQAWKKYIKRGIQPDF